MKVKLLLVAELEVTGESAPELAAISRLQELGESADIDFYTPAVMRTFERAGSKSAEVFY